MPNFSDVQSGASSGAPPLRRGPNFSDVRGGSSSTPRGPGLWQRVKDVASGGQVGDGAANFNLLDWIQNAFSGEQTARQIREQEKLNYAQRYKAGDTSPPPDTRSLWEKFDAWCLETIGLPAWIVVSALVGAVVLFLISKR